jgi:hypothetical protein
VETLYESCFTGCECLARVSFESGSRLSCI